MFAILSNLRAVLETTPARWQSLAAAFPEDLLRRPPAPGEWSALECLQHLIDFDQKAIPKRFQAFFSDVEFPGFSPAADGTALRDSVSAQSLAGQFMALRLENLKLLEGITPADFERQAVHPQLGPVTLINLLHQWGGHDLMHLRQAEQALMQPFIEGSGVWQVFFEQHVVRANPT